MIEPVNPRRPIRERLSREAMLLKGIPSEFMDADLDDFLMDEDFRVIITNYIKHLPEMREKKASYLFYGANGTGKTHLSSIIIREAYRQRYTSMRVTVKEYIQMQFERDDEEIRDKINKVKNCDFLVLDELGKEVFGKASHNITEVEELLRLRDTAGRPTIICTNLPLEGEDGIQGNYGGSIYSLVNGNYLKELFEGQDLRKRTTNDRGILDLLEEGLEE